MDSAIHIKVTTHINQSQFYLIYIELPGIRFPSFYFLLNNNVNILQSGDISWQFITWLWQCFKVSRVILTY